MPYQEVRYPADSVIAQPIEAGKYISIYWITEGQYENHLRFAVGTNQRLFADGRVFMDRDHTFTSFQRYLGPIYRDDDGPRDIHSLDYPYGGLVVEVIDANDSAARDELVEWLRTERAPGSDSPVAMGMMFAPMPLPDDKQPYVKDVEGVDDRITILWFTEGDSLDAWDEFAGAGERGRGDRPRPASSSWRPSRRRSPAPTATSTSCGLRSDAAIPMTNVTSCPSAAARRPCPEPEDDEMTQLGPVELLFVEFPGNQFTGEIIPALSDLIDQGTIRVLDLVFVAKDADGNAVGIELEDLPAESKDAFTDLVEELAELISDEDVEDLAEALRAELVRRDPAVRAHVGDPVPGRPRQLGWPARGATAHHRGSTRRDRSRGLTRPSPVPDRPTGRRHACR